MYPFQVEDTFVKRFGLKITVNILFPVLLSGLIVSVQIFSAFAGGIPSTNPHYDCAIREITLYTPGDRKTGVINYEWNDNGFGRTGTTGFDVLRWKWATYHLNGQAQQNTVRRGDTLETVGFDWKVSPQSIMDANSLESSAQLQPGQVIWLPAPEALYFNEQRYLR
jgi:hypothetical protein